MPRALFVHDIDSGTPVRRSAEANEWLRRDTTMSATLTLLFSAEVCLTFFFHLRATCTDVIPVKTYPDLKITATALVLVWRPWHVKAVYDSKVKVVYYLRLLRWL